MLAAAGTQNIDFLVGIYIFLQGTSGGQTNSVYTLEAKTLVFLQENVHFWTQKMFSWMHGGAKYSFSCSKMKAFGRGPKAARMDEPLENERFCRYEWGQNALETKNIGFLTGKCTFLDTEDV